MTKLNKNELLVGLLLVLLIARDIPYLNLLSVDKIWVGYIFLLFLFIIFNFSANKLNYPLLFIVFLFLVAMFTVLNMPNASDLGGIALYLLLWLIVVTKLINT